MISFFFFFIFIFIFNQMVNTWGTRRCNKTRYASKRCIRSEIVNRYSSFMFNCIAIAGISPSDNSDFSPFFSLVSRVGRWLVWLAGGLAWEWFSNGDWVFSERCQKKKRKSYAPPTERNSLLNNWACVRTKTTFTIWSNNTLWFITKSSVNCFPLFVDYE